MAARPSLVAVVARFGCEAEFLVCLWHASTSSLEISSHSAVSRDQLAKRLVRYGYSSLGQRTNHSRHRAAPLSTPTLDTSKMMGATEDAGGPPAAAEELPPPAQSQFSISSPDEVAIPPSTPDDAAVPSVTGEGTMSDGKGNLKKVLFLSGGDANQPPKENASKGWSLSDVSRRASAAQASLQQMMKKQEPRAAELAQNARKSAQDAAEATRKAAGDASAKISKLMGSAPVEGSFDESGAMAREDAAPSESRLDKLKAAFKPKENPEVSALRAEVAELREEVARLAARVEELSAAK